MSPADAAEALRRGVAAQFRRRLQDEQLPRIRRCVELLGDGRVWQRPAPHCNSVGNLILHLCGNTTQWILASFGATDDRRDRPAEFAAQDSATGPELIAMLASVYERAAAVVQRVDVGELLRPRRIQGYDETGLSAVLHVLEHSSGHAGQIYAWTKQVTGLDLRFYDL